MVAMALDDGSLYAAVKVLASVLETNSTMQQEMKRIDGYKVGPAAASDTLKNKEDFYLSNIGMNNAKRTLLLAVHCESSPATEY